MSAARNRMRIAMICPNYYPLTCGVGDFSMWLARELAARGNEVALFTHSPAKRNPACPSVAVYEAAGQTPLEVTRAMRKALFEFEPSEVVVQYTPDMLQASRFGSPAIPVLMAELRSHARVTTIFHEFYIPWSWRPDLAVAAAVQRLQFSAVLGVSDRLFVTTAPRKSRLEAILSAAGDQRAVEVVFIGANAPPLEPRAHVGPHRLGIFSMLGSTRRFDLMVDAFALVHERYPDSELVLIGNLGTDAAPRYRALKAHIARSPVAKFVRLTGALPLSRVAEEVEALDVYLLPDVTGACTRSSTLPVALASGVPVVATCGPETASDFFIDGENIAYARAMTAPALATSALSVLDNPTWATKLGAAGRRLYQQHLSWHAIADQLLPQQTPQASHVDMANRH